MSTAPVLDVRPHATAIKAALKATLGQWDAFEDDEIDKTNLPSIFAVIAIERRFVEPDRSGRSGRSGWRVEVRFVGRSIGEAQWAGAKVAEALDGERLTVAGHRSTPLHHESSTAASPDGGEYSGRTIYTYAL